MPFTGESGTAISALPIRIADADFATLVTAWGEATRPAFVAVPALTMDGRATTLLLDLADVLFVG